LEAVDEPLSTMSLRCRRCRIEAIEIDLMASGEVLRVALVLVDPPIVGVAETGRDYRRFKAVDHCCVEVGRPFGVEWPANEPQRATDEHCVRDTP
jgi:hypothetical protein